MTDQRQTLVTPEPDILLRRYTVACGSLDAGVAS